MKKAVLGCLLLTIGGCGGGNTPDGVAKEGIDLMNEYAVVLDSIKDKASGDAAAPKLKSIAKRGDELKKRLDDLKLSKDDMDKLKEKYRKEGEEANIRLLGAMKNINDVFEKDPQLKKTVDDAMKKN